MSCCVTEPVPGAPAARVSGTRIGCDEHAVATPARSTATATVPVMRGERAIRTSVLVVVRLLGVALLHEDEDVAPRILEPGGAQADDVRDALGEEMHALALELCAGGCEVVAHEPHVTPAVVGERGVGRLRPTRRPRVLDDLYDAVAADDGVADADDGALHGHRRRDQLAH